MAIAITWRLLAKGAFSEFCSRLPSADYDQVTVRDDAEQLTAVVWDRGDIERNLKYAARALAKECINRDFTGFMALPSSIENGIADAEDDLKLGNISMRIIRTWDVMEAQMIYRLDVIGACELPKIKSRFIENQKKVE